MGSEEQTDQGVEQTQPLDIEDSLVADVLDDAESADSTVEPLSMQDELDAANARADDNWAKVLLATAEVENVRRRSQKDIEKAHRFSIEKFAKDMLPVVDSLEMGMAAADETSADVEAIKEGMALTYKQLISALKQSGIEQVNPEDEIFSPELHQAISVVPSPDHEPNTVIQVFQKGYTLNGRLLRPAMVIVSQSTPPEGTKKIDEQA
ncbi:MAG: molecular chaperone GrpE [Cycloclasticus sp.]|jgi:molecular chaperone GrpE|tara:strand:+ start:340 stop:963 length:624 start_codon:yes stop_codon:yes gene_type:complete